MGKAVVIHSNPYLAFLLIIAIFAAGCRRSETPASPNQEPASEDDTTPVAEAIDSVRPNLKSGDIILRRGITLTSYFIIHSTKPNQKFTHIGIIFIHDGKISVINAEDNEDTGGNGKVQLTTLEKFTQKASAIGFYRFNESSSKQEAVAQSALAYLGVPFDEQLDMDDHSTIFCTELVELAMKDAGFSTLPMRVHSTFFQRIILPPDSFTVPELAQPLLSSP